MVQIQPLFVGWTLRIHQLPVGGIQVAFHDRKERFVKSKASARSRLDLNVSTRGCRVWDSKEVELLLVAG